LKQISNFLSKEKSILWIIAIGAALRLLFVFFIGEIYYGHADYFIQRDTSSWFGAFINLWEHGTFQVNSTVEAAKFFRPPGYSFLFGIFYLATFKNYVLAWKLLVASQVIMDIVSIYLVYRIALLAARNSVKENRVGFASLCALLYAVYPFVIIWAPVLIAETSSIFFILLSVLFAFEKRTLKSAFLSGLFGGIATLIRLQCAFGIFFIGAVFFLADYKNFFRNLRFGFMFCFAVLISYGLWPARNLIFHHRILFSQDLEIGHHWSRDFMSFLDFVHSVSTDHTTYYYQILRNEKVTWPPSAYLDPGDSALLDSAVTLCRTCGSGWSYWRWGEHMVPKLMVPEQPCDTAIDKIFTSLYKKQKTKNAFHYWVSVPVQNLQKSLFKISLYEPKSRTVKLISSILFIFRSALLLLGLFGIFLAYRNKYLKKSFLIFVLSYFTAWYFYISFFYRNMEMRYLLQTDILMLLPAAYVLWLMFNKDQKVS
jgi:hypothetical protein